MPHLVCLPYLACQQLASIAKVWGSTLSFSPLRFAHDGISGRGTELAPLPTQHDDAPQIVCVGELYGGVVGCTWKGPWKSEQKQSNAFLV